MTIKTMANWFGSDRKLAQRAGYQLGRRDHVVVPFCGGGSELAFIKAISGIASDKHRHLINLTRTIREPELKDELVRRLDATLYHPEELSAAQARCIARESPILQTIDVPGQMIIGADQPVGDVIPLPTDQPDVAWAYDYFLCSWMTRGGQAGTRAEFTQGLSFRWNAGGGDSCKRLRSASESLGAWCKIVRPWNFICRDAFEIIPICLEKEKIELKKPAAKQESRGMFVDAPWPDQGDAYKHPFDEAKQRRLAEMLSGFDRTRVVIRFGEHPLIRELYPEPHWRWILQSSRSQGNNEIAEVLIVNGDPYV